MTLTERETKRGEIMLHKLIEEAAGNRPLVPGVRYGKKSKYFVIGDFPTQKDLVVGQPFSGPMGEVLSMTLSTLGQKESAEMEDVYATYLVKAIYGQGEMSEKMIIESWLPIAQLEYALSGCDRVVAIGKVSKMFAGYVVIRPSVLSPVKPGIMDKAREIWRTLKS